MFLSEEIQADYDDAKTQVQRLEREQSHVTWVAIVLCAGLGIGRELDWVEVDFWPILWVGIALILYREIIQIRVDCLKAEMRHIWRTFQRA